MSAGPHPTDRLDAFADGELDPVQSAEIEAHLAACPECREGSDAIERARAAVRDKASYFRASDALRRRIDLALSSAGGARRPAAPRWLAMAAAVTAAAIGGAALMQWASARSSRSLADAVVDSHVRGLQIESHLFDVPSSDQHTVKPWFSGHLDFAPKVADLGASDFVLAGGRLEYVAGRPAAALVYRYRKHTITVFQWPHDGGQRPASAQTRRGFAVVRWADASLEYWAVSDVDRDRLLALAGLIQANAPAEP